LKKLFMAAALTIGAFSAVPTMAADVGVSINVGQPGFYGRLDIGDFPRPSVIYSRPIYVEREARVRPPIYLRVPPGHAKHWRKHCAEYNACGERVYFVRDSWYEHEYVPRYREHHGDHNDDRRGDDNGYGDHDNRGDHGDRGKHGHGGGRGNRGRD
jgi:hypothetical protein